MNSKVQFSIASVSSACATALVEAKAHDDKAQASREVANQRIAELHKAKAVIGRYGKCAGATAFVDGLMAGKLSKKTAQNYLSLFRDAVASGKPVLDWGGSKGGAKRGNAKGSAKGKKEFADKLATVYRDEDFAGFIDDLEESYKNDEIKTLIDGVRSYLELNGVKLD